MSYVSEKQYGQQMAKDDLHDVKEDFTDEELRRYARGMAKDAKDLQEKLESGEIVSGPVFAHTLGRILEGAADEYKKFASSGIGKVVPWRTV
jgi:hypothetical protein